ncbi:MAG TPA: hypothetical protein PKN75_15205 [Bacteroidia bacterium]|nr:hypothetical protein [Bacteroidia bacterium]
MAEYNIPLLPGGIYHIYNHAISSENLFDTDKDYNYFLGKMHHYILPVGDVLAYCLMPIHYHLLINFKTENEIKSFLKNKIKHAKSIEELSAENADYLSNQISQVFSNLFNTYSKHYNFINRRTGSLFKRNFRRRAVDTKDYLQQVICYIHQNPVAAGMVSDLKQWKYSSYESVISNNNSIVDSKATVDVFDNLDNFIFCHRKMTELDLDA